MCILKIVNNEFYNHRESFFTEIEYILRPDKAVSGYICCNYVYLRSCMEAAYQFEETYRIFGMQGRCLHHFVISFATDGSEGYIHEGNALRIVQNALISMGIADNYQYIMALHEDTDNIHIHVVLNATGFKTGWKFLCNKREQRELKDKLQFFTLMERRNMGKIYKKRIGYEEPEEAYTLPPRCEIVYSSTV